MKVSLDWLKKYVSVNIDLKNLISSLTMLGLEVESSFDRFDYLKNVLVGRIEELNRHSISPDLSLCVINYGENYINVICGAKNIRVGMLAPVALTGTMMPSGLVVSEQKIRGHISSGILCSEYDLAIGINHERTMQLNDNAKIGQSLKSLIGLSDFILDIALTPNRPDCSSLIGIAREVAAIQRIKYRVPYFFTSEKIYNNTKKNISVKIIPRDKCKYYLARMFDNIEVKSSPYWLQNRLISVGLKPINNIVDITNFVMFETGQPLHAFDFDLIVKENIVVDVSRDEKSFITLENKEVILPKGILTISDTNKPIAIAGLIGGLNSKVTKRTKRILLESAYFDPTTIRKASKILGISTESSYRFERGVDPEGVLKAFNRATNLILELTNASIVRSFDDQNHRILRSEDTIPLDIEKTNRVLGTTLTFNQISSILTSLEFSIEVIDKKKINVKVPSFRVDIKRSEDLMEEVARLYGYDNIPISFPKFTFSKFSQVEFQKEPDRIRSILNGCGFSEIINYSFSNVTSCDYLNLPKDDYRRRQINIMNPLSSSQSVMRTSLIPSFLETIQRNISKKEKDLMFFELGKVFIANGENELPNEIEMLVASWTGNSIKSSWCTKEKKCSFFDIKGSLEELLISLNVKNLYFTKLEDSLCYYMRKGHTAKVMSSDIVLGLVGEVDSSLLDYYLIKERTFIFEINIKLLYESISKSIFLKPLARFPAVSRDATVIIDEDLESNYLISIVKNLNEILVENIYILDVFRGANISSGMKSISFRVIYRSNNNTLDDKIVNRLHKYLINFLVNKTGALLPPS